MSDWNEAKLETLEDAFAFGEISSSDLADSRGLSLQAASRRLHRYQLQGLFRREKIGKKYFYDITKKGIDRIDWLREKKVNEELFQAIAAKRCPIKREKIMAPEIEQEQSFIGSEIAPEINIFKDFSDKRCPVIRHSDPDTPGSVDLDEEIDFDEEDFDDPDEYDNYQEEMDKASMFLKNIQRCRVNKEENDPISVQDSDEEEEDIEDILKRLSLQRCKVISDDID